jgi:hypothetical protein
MRSFIFHILPCYLTSFRHGDALTLPATAYLFSYAAENWDLVPNEVSFFIHHE